MNTLYDSRSPAPGVKVLPCGGSGNKGLNMTQAAAARKLMTSTPIKDCTHHMNGFVGVMRPQRLGGGIGLGMMSTVCSANAALSNVNAGDKAKMNPKYNPVLRTTHAPLGTVRPGSKRRGHCRAAANVMFYAHIPNRMEMKHREVAGLQAQVLGLYKAVLKGNDKLDRKYRTMRHLLVANLDAAGERNLESMEQRLRGNFRRN